MARRTTLKREDKRLLARIRGQHWTAEELRWVLAHLDPNAPTLAHLAKASFTSVGNSADSRRPTVSRCASGPAGGRSEG